MKRWAVKHRQTGHYIPDPKGRYNNRGGSFSEPDPDSNKARLFKSERAAKNFISAWVKGNHLADYDYEDGLRYTVGYIIQPVETRCKENMEVVLVEISLP